MGVGVDHRAGIRLQQPGVAGVQLRHGAAQGADQRLGQFLLHQQQAAAQIEVEKPFPQEEELAEKSARLAELNAQLDVDEKSHEPEQEEEPDEDAPRRPSVLAALEEKSDKPEPVKPFRSYYDKDGDAR